MKLNLHTSHPSAFISSTFIDLYDDRIEVAKILKKRGLNVNALDVKPASNESSKKEIQDGIRESDFVILLIGDRYGSILPSMTGSDSRSITWWEYDMARRMGKPVIAFFKRIDSTDPNAHDSSDDTDYRKKRKLFERFKNLVSDKHNPGYYKEIDDLVNKIDQALISIYRSGVKELRLLNDKLEKKVSDLESEVNRLKANAPTPLDKVSFSGLGLGGLQRTSQDSKPTARGLGLADLFNDDEK
tara:strand:- start:3256 stop:3984 length:729 start_codon:yes stop_codon:yes gene_type:complete